MLDTNKTIAKEKEYYSLVADVDGTPHGPILSRTSDSLNSKISGLLSHISIMIAILSFFLSQMGDFKRIDFFTFAITIEIIFYLCFTVGCLRGLFITSPRSLLEKGKESTNHIIMIIRRRRRIYLLSLKGTIIVTIAFLITLAEKVFIHTN